MVRIRLFGVYREWCGVAETIAEPPPGGTAADLVALLRREPGFERLPERPALAVNRRYVGPDHPLREGDEVALIPPVAGG